MNKLNAVLGMPQNRFASIHVVGTNGKSSVTLMTAALLQAHGVRVGACVSPHAAHWSERTRIDGAEIGEVEFAAAVERSAEAAAVVNRTLEGGEAITQFELATAATFVALAGARVEVAVIEAGLGGRLDATNTIPSLVTVLTSIGLDHTEWLGETEAEIAAEKLAVLRDHTTLVLGQVSPEVAELAERTASERGAKLVRAPEDPGSELQLRAPGGFQRRNFALAQAAAGSFLGDLDHVLVAEVASTLAIPGRLERIAESPPTYIDAAHNPDGAAALAEALPGIAADGAVVACLAILADKDAEAMVAALAPAVDRVVCTELPVAALESQGRPGAASRPAAELADICEAAGLPAEAAPDFEIALHRSRELAGRISSRGAGAGATSVRTPDGVLVVTGSHYVLAPARVALQPASHA
jgi:dihydrofolate synthase / folylpolyglutamate synthase